MADEDVTKIRAALEILRVPRPKQRRPHSWIKGQLETDAGGVCIVGALNRVGQTVWSDSRMKDQEAILRVAKEQFPNDRIFGVEYFNDTKGRTFEEVEIVLEKAAILREEEGARSDWTLE